MKKFCGKVIVVTGGSSGIGKGLCEAWAADNAVIDLSRSSVTSEEFSLTPLPERGLFRVTCDVGSEQSVSEAFGLIKSAFGRVDVLVNNAGYGVSGATELLSDEEVARIFEVNVLGVYRCCRHALALMGEGGRIANISSACAIFPLPFRGAYCSSKAAVSMMSHSLREEVKPYGIAVTAICPGDVKTPFTVHRVKNFTTNERYGGRIKDADDRVARREHKRMSPEYAVNAIRKIVEKRAYKPLYVVGKKYKLLYAAYRLFPLGAILGVTGRAFAPKQKEEKGNEKKPQA